MYIDFVGGYLDDNMMSAVEADSQKCKKLGLQHFSDPVAKNIGNYYSKSLHHKNCHLPSETTDWLKNK